MQFAQAPDLTELTDTFWSRAWCKKMQMRFQPTYKPALINRLDIRTALVQYAIAENAEIRNCKAVSWLSPGYAYEFYDRSLVFYYLIV
jgi:hypothetical protein